MNTFQRLQLICKAVDYCQDVATHGMPVRAYTKALREPIFFLWEARATSKKEEMARWCTPGARGLRPGRDEVKYDHSIPFTYLQQELMGLEVVEPETVRPLLERLTVTAMLTTEENRELTRKFAKKMPQDWDGKDPLARYRAAGIEIIENALWVRPIDD